jgi:hypothetical protein
MSLTPESAALLEHVADILTRMEGCIVSVLALNPGDTLVLRSQYKLSQAAYERLSSSMKELFPDHKYALLECGLSLEVLRPMEIDHA